LRVYFKDEDEKRITTSQRRAFKEDEIANLDEEEESECSDSLVEECEEA